MNEENDRYFFFDEGMRGEEKRIATEKKIAIARMVSFVLLVFFVGMVLGTIYPAFINQYYDECINQSLADICYRMKVPSLDTLIWYLLNN